MLRTKKISALVAGSIMGVGYLIPALAAIADQKPYYNYDYYKPADPSIVLNSYQGIPVKTHTVSRTPLTIQAEDFDKGEEGVAFRFKNKEGELPKVSDGNGGKVISHVSNGDFLCYTIDVKDGGNYRITVNASSDSPRALFFEIDGNPSASPIKIEGTGWGDYLTAFADGFQLTPGRHILKWVPEGSMNFDSFKIERVGDYDAKAAQGINIEYPRTARYTHNPLFVNWDSPMWESPFTGPLYTADPSAHVYNGRLYVYASHDMEPPVGCDRMDRYHLFSTDDMENWTDHGEIMNAATSNELTGTTGEGFMWAPDCVYNPRDKKYYFVYPHKIDGSPEELGVPDPVGNNHQNAGWGHFLATSDSPEGPFTPIGYIRGIPDTIDPCIFVDTDGQPYIYTSGQRAKGSWVGKLNPDNWLELIPFTKEEIAKGRLERMEGVDRMMVMGEFEDFHEAPFVIKIGDIYYLQHSDNNPENNYMRYSISDSPIGPWKMMGAFMTPHGHDTTHGSFVNFNGKWYQFYHTADFSGQIGGNRRSVCFDEIKFNKDGSIAMMNTWGKPVDGKPIDIDGKKKTAVISANRFNDGGNAKGFYVRDDNNAPTRDSRSIALGAQEWLRYSIKADGGKYRVKVRARQLKKNSGLTLMSNGEYLIDRRGIKFDNGVTDAQELIIEEVTLPAGEQYFEIRCAMGALEVEDFKIEKI